MGEMAGGTAGLSQDPHMTTGKGEKKEKKNKGK